MELTKQLLANVEVRRNNGQCAYGEWLAVAEAPSWVGDMIADERVENDADCGQVERAGSIWDWRITVQDTPLN